MNLSPAESSMHLEPRELEVARLESLSKNFIRRWRNLRVRCPMIVSIIGAVPNFSIAFLPTRSQGIKNTVCSKNRRAFSQTTHSSSSAPQTPSVSASIPGFFRSFAPQRFR